MFSFGWSEITIVIVIIIIVIGPKEIPNLLRQLGAFSKSLRKVSREFKNSLNDLANENDIKEVKKSLNEVNKLKDNLNPTKEFEKDIKNIKDTTETINKDISDINSKLKKD